MAKVLDFSRGENGQRRLKNMGIAGRERVVGIFSQESMAKSLESSLDGLATSSPRLQHNDRKGSLLPGWAWLALGIVAFALVLGWSIIGAFSLLLKQIFASQASASTSASSVSAAAAAATSSLYTKVRGEL